jgi:hypothetical protein
MTHNVTALKTGTDTWEFFVEGHVFTVERIGKEYCMRANVTVKERNHNNKRWFSTRAKCLYNQIKIKMVRGTTGVTFSCDRWQALKWLLSQKASDPRWGERRQSEEPQLLLCCVDEFYKKIEETLAEYNRLQELLAISLSAGSEDAELASTIISGLMYDPSEDVWLTQASDFVTAMRAKIPHKEQCKDPDYA